MSKTSEEEITDEETLEALKDVIEDEGGLEVQKTEFEKIISSLQQTKSLFDPLIKSNWLVESMIKNKFYDPFQMRMEYKID